MIPEITRTGNGAATFYFPVPPAGRGSDIGKMTGTVRRSNQKWKAELVCSGSKSGTFVGWGDTKMIAIHNAARDAVGYGVT